MNFDPLPSIRPKVILFDVYGTLLDMRDVENRLNRILDSKRGYLIWFEMFMQYCFVDNCTDQFNDFNAIAEATMHMTARALGGEIDSDQIRSVLDLLKQVPLHEGMQAGFSELVQHDYRIAALTNSSEKIIKERMERTGLISYFEMVLSAEHVKKYKPCIEVYQWAARQLRVAQQEVLLVTSHGWDIAGAANAGMLTAYMNRGHEVLYPLAPKPHFSCESIPELLSLLQKIPPNDGEESRIPEEEPHFEKRDLNEAEEY